MPATTSPPQHRIHTLDIVRGVAVMGILAMNIISFGLPAAAYVNPPTIGIEGPADWAAWLFGFLFIDGKMRGLFSLLFGASMLLVMERAAERGESATGVHLRRMGWLLAFGLVHFYCIWSGDILILYAVIGVAAYLFRKESSASLLSWSIVLLMMQLLITGGAALGLFAAAGQLSGPAPDPQAAAIWSNMVSGFGVAPGELTLEIAIHRGSYDDVFAYRMDELGSWPFYMLFDYGAETLAYFLLGMWALRSGFLAGTWEDRAYRRVAFICLALALPAYVLLAYWQWISGFRVEVLFAAQFALALLPRPLMVIAMAALIILWTRGGGALTSRISAAGRAAFTNYLGASIVLTTLFYGYGLGWYGHLSRTELWGVVLACWAGMLLWSKPWLERFAYGPFEWLWRSLARGRLQPMRKQAAPVAAHP